MRVVPIFSSDSQQVSKNCYFPKCWTHPLRFHVECEAWGGGGDDTVSCIVIHVHLMLRWLSIRSTYPALPTRLLRQPCYRYCSTSYIVTNGLSSKRCEIMRKYDTFKPLQTDITQQVKVKRRVHRGDNKWSCFNEKKNTSSLMIC